MNEERDYVESDGGFALLNIGSDADGIVAPEAGWYRMCLPVYAAETRRHLRAADEPPPGPWLKLTPHGIHIVTPPGAVDDRGNTVHTISRERAEDMIRTLQWMVDAKVEVVTDV